MHVPSAAELAAIAAAYSVLTRRPGAPPAPAETPRWGLAGRLATPDAPRARLAARSASRWNAAGRLDG